MRSTIRQILTKKPYFDRCHFQGTAFFSTQISKKNSNGFLNYQVDLNTGKHVKALFSKIEQEDKNNFKASNCLVTLSIGQPIHYGPYLAATLNLINKSFNSCTFVLGDTLQRHTMGIMNPSLSDEELFQLSEEKGDLWLRDNMHLLSKLRIPWNVRRWNHWLEHRRFNELLGSIQKAYSSEPAYKRFFDRNIEAYLERLKKRGELHTGTDHAEELCLRYLKEECAAMLSWIEENCQFELYANGRTPAMQATYERFIKTLHPDLLKPISLRFKRISSHNNQIFDDPTEEVKSGAAKYLIK